MENVHLTAGFDERWLNYQFLLHHSYIFFLKGWENLNYNLRSERVNEYGKLVGLEEVKYSGTIQKYSYPYYTWISRTSPAQPTDITNQQSDDHKLDGDERSKSHDNYVWRTVTWFGYCWNWNNYIKWLFRIFTHLHLQEKNALQCFLMIRTVDVMFANNTLQS